MNLKVIGLNHRTSTLEKREGALRILSGLDGILLATCNRVELYVMSNDKCQMSNAGAIKHLFRVAAGLDSQILGETEILGQVKSAIVGADHDLPNNLRSVFKKAVEVGVRVRQETGISRGNVSIASVAVAKALNLLEGDKKRRVLLIGSGKITEAVLKNLLKRNFNFVLVANRTFEKAKELAERIGGTAIKFDHLKEELQNTDLVISSTAAPHLVLKKGQIGEREKPLIIIDLAVPRDVDPNIVGADNVSLYNIDDIKEEINLNFLKRKIEAIKAEQIVEEEVRWFCERYALEPAAAV